MLQRVSGDAGTEQPSCSDPGYLGLECREPSEHLRVVSGLFDGSGNCLDGTGRQRCDSGENQKKPCRCQLSDKHQERHSSGSAVRQGEAHCVRIRGHQEAFKSWTGRAVCVPMYLSMVFAVRLVPQELPSVSEALRRWSWQALGGVPAQ